MNCNVLFRDAALTAMRAIHRLQPVNTAPGVAITKSPHAAPLSVTRQQSFIRASSSNRSIAEATDQVDALVKRRQELLQLSPFQLLRIKGVTFENRQELVQQLVPGQPLMFIKEPSNPYDPAAVEIRTLDGKQLGHVSRHLTNAFQLQVCFGSVYSKGETMSGTWGALVSCCPPLHGLALDLLPHSWKQQIDFEQVLGQQQWQKLQLHVINKYQQHCAITSAHTEQDSIQLQVIPRWLFDYHRQEVGLVDFIPVAKPLAEMHQQLSSTATAADPAAVKQQAVDVMSRVMHWTEEESQKYVEFALERQQMVDQQEWKLVGVEEDHCQHFVKQR